MSREPLDAATPARITVDEDGAAWVNAGLYMDQNEWLSGIAEAGSGDTIWGCPHCGHADYDDRPMEYEPPTVLWHFECNYCDMAFAHKFTFPDRDGIETEIVDAMDGAPDWMTSLDAHLERRDPGTLPRLPEGERPRSRLEAFAHSEASLYCMNGARVECSICGSPVQFEGGDLEMDPEMTCALALNDCPSCAKQIDFEDQLPNNQRRAPRRGYRIVRPPHSEDDCNHELFRLVRADDEALAYGARIVMRIQGGKVTGEVSERELF